MTVAEQEMAVEFYRAGAVRRRLPGEGNTDA